jgi:biopolymer transport protein ExbD
MPKVMAQPSANEGRGRRGRRVSTTLSEINVIPLVDVMLVLLIIFMVAAPMMQRGVEVNLPVARQTQKMSEQRLYVTVPDTYAKDRRVFISAGSSATSESIPETALAERLRQEMLNKQEREVFLRGDGQVRLQELIDVFERLKEGGIERVGIVTTPRGQ